MKKPPTEIQIRLKGKVLQFKDVPESKIMPIVIALKKYQSDTEYVSWRSLSNSRIGEAGGESAYMLRGAREAAGMTQQELAGKLNIPQSNISQIETGSRSIGKNLAKRLSKIFNLDYRVFL